MQSPKKKTTNTSDQISDERREILSELAGVMEETDLIELMENAESSDNEVAYLRKALTDIVGGSPAIEAATSEQDVEFLRERGITIEVRSVAKTDRLTNKQVQVPIGYLIRREVNGGTLYAGRNMAWNMPARCFPFADEQTARTVAVRWVQGVESAGSVPDYEIKEVSSVVPFAVLPNPTSGCRMITVRLSGETLDKLNAVLVGCKQRNAKDDDTPIQNYPQAIRYLINSIKVT